MRIYSSLCILSLNLIINTEIAQSYVLLTANIEDIKKIAKKIVTQSLADQIIDFVAKVISKEHEINANNAQDLTSDAIYKGNSPDNILEYKKKTIKIKNNGYKKENVDSLSKERNKHSYSKMPTNERQKYKDSKDTKPYKYYKPKEKYDIKHKQSVNKQWYEISPKVETSTERENIVYKEKRNQYRFKIKSKNARTANDADGRKQIRDNNDIENGSFKLKTTTKISYDVDRVSVEKTTERIPDSEIDYENYKYSKKDFVGTNESVSLMRVTA